MFVLYTKKLTIGHKDLPVTTALRIDLCGWLAQAAMKKHKKHKCC